MKRVVMIMGIGGILLGQTGFAAGYGLEEEKRSAVLAINTPEIKDPIMAYNLALVPIAGHLAASNYLSSSPVKWQENIPEVRSKAIMATLADVAAIGIGTYLMATSWKEEDVTTTTESFSYITTNSEFSTGKFFAGAILVCVVPPIINHFFGNYCAKWAVGYNKKIYKQFNYEPPQFE